MHDAMGHMIILISHLGNSGAYSVNLFLLGTMFAAVFSLSFIILVCHSVANDSIDSVITV